jgi:uncharacterized Ntn-hydrolase superfamily protein
MITTFSIVGYDPDTREWGIAVQSKFLAVGAAVPFARAEVGAIATQALANLRYGPDGLELLAAGTSAQDAVTRLVEADDGREHRQVGIVDSTGAGATYTGSACLGWAGGRAGQNYAAQGNLLRSAETVDALAETFESFDGERPLAERLVASLQAGQHAGGDRRGQQAAALLVVRTGGGYGGRSDRLIDLRVDDHERPIDELGRLLEIHRLLFGTTPDAEWIDVEPQLREKIRRRLADLGYQQPTLQEALDAWAGTENLEERVSGVERVDPVVLAALGCS